jgi:hypothetical protein
LASAALLSIVVVTRNRPVDFGRCLRSLERLTYPELEFIVVDDCSAESLRERFEAGSPRSRWFRAERNVGVAMARNIGARLARGEYLWFLDDDAEVLRADAGERLVAKLASEPAVGALGGEALVDESGAVVGVKSFDLASNGMTPGSFHPGVASESWLEVPLLIGCNILMRRDDFRALGGFDPNYGFEWEDTDLSVRLRAAGKTLLVAGFAPVLHHLSPAERPRRLRVRARGRAYFVAKNAAWSRLLVMPLLDLGYLASPRRWARWIDKAGRVEFGARGRVVRPSGPVRLSPRRLIASFLVALDLAGVLLGGYFVGWRRIRQGLAARRDPPDGWKEAAAQVAGHAAWRMSPLAEAGE